MYTIYLILYYIYNFTSKKIIISPMFMLWKNIWQFEVRRGKKDEHGLFRYMIFPAFNLQLDQGFSIDVK